MGNLVTASLTSSSSFVGQVLFHQMTVLETDLHPDHSESLKLANVRQKYIRAKLLNDTARRVISANGQLYYDIEDHMVAAFTKQHLNMPKSDESFSLMGLCSSDIDYITKTVNSDTFAAFCDEMEQLWRDDLQVLSELKLTDTIDELPDIMSDLVRRHKTWPARRLALRTESFQLWIEFEQIIAESTQLLIQLINTYMLGHEVEKNKSFESYFGVIVDNLQLKMEMTRMEILLSTYKPDVVSKLKHRQQNLNEQQKSLEEEQIECEERLNIYNQVGPEFQHIVSSYKQLMEQIEEAHRDIQMLKR